MNYANIEDGKTSNIRNFIRKYGFFNTTIVITIFSIFLSISLALLAHLLYPSKDMHYVIHLAALIPIIVAPVVTFVFLKLLFDLDKAEHEKMKLIDELKIALENVKTLEGLLPICSNCKNIRDDSGYWYKVEEYLNDNSELEFTHSICPECAKNTLKELREYEASLKS